MSLAVGLYAVCLFVSCFLEPTTWDSKERSLSDISTGILYGNAGQPWARRSGGSCLHVLPIMPRKAWPSNMSSTINAGTIANILHGGRYLRYKSVTRVSCRGEPVRAPASSASS